MPSRTHVALALSLGWLISLSAGAEARQSQAARDETYDIPMHPSALAQLIDELGGRQISLPRAKIVSVISPRAFLVESAGPLAPTRGSLDRVIILVDKGSIRLDPETLVGSTVKITGVARTVLGMQVTREVAWPRELTRDVLRRYEIRAAVLAPSVQTPDGVELVSQLEE
jgi:hypothetical protein